LLTYVTPPFPTMTLPHHYARRAPLLLWVTRGPRRDAVRHREWALRPARRSERIAFSETALSVHPTSKTRPLDGCFAPLAVVQPVVGRARKPSLVQWRTIPCRLDVNGDKGWEADGPVTHASGAKRTRINLAP
jgi:hypothetical protein